MKKLTAIIPTGNEEHNIEDVIKSVSFADEIMVVDSFSKDRTVEIARSLAHTVIQREYINSASQKNWAIPQASHEWILVVDADERVTPELKKEIQEILSREDEPFVAYTIYLNEHFMGQRMYYSSLQSNNAVRFFKRDKCRYEEKHVHADIIADGPIGVLKGKFNHHTYRDFDTFINKLNRYAWWQARDYEKKVGKITIVHVIFKPFFRFCKHYVFRLGFLDGFAGFAYAYTQSYAVMTRYIKLWLLRRGIK
jgi:glycosyltransferase involved in cell wall biosynthesis